MRSSFTILLLMLAISLNASQHPNLILTADGVKQMKESLGDAPLFDATLELARDEVDQEISGGIHVPIPRDLAGGYTHERHKANFFTMQKAGILFQVTGDEKYAVYIRDMLLEYAALYPTFDKHPAERSYARGKFFWQCLNDANWLVYTSQAYDCIYEWLDDDTIEKLNTELFRPYAEFISIKNPQFFNRIHNHSTWGNAAVGMIGLVMNDSELVNWSLYGLVQGIPGEFVNDNDGGSIQLEGQKSAGFFAQLDHAFSPDGYYTEGPYYQRYAMYPFLIFAQALTTNKPDLNILEYRNDLLIKSVVALVNQTNAAGEFFPINDAQKGMSLKSRELVNAVSMAYYYGGDEQLLSIIEDQQRVPLNDAGLAAAKAISHGKSRPFVFKSMELSDGAMGDEGAIGILRNDSVTLVMKYAKHGMGHGHFDRLGFLLFNGTEEVFQDYGSARWVNIEHKDGGGYLKENTTWAKQTIAHNTLVVDKDSHFDGDVKSADLTSAVPYLFDISNPEFQVVSAKELNAYPGVSMHRTMALMDLDELERPLILDLFTVQAADETRYDLPLYYMGEFMSINQEYETIPELIPMGNESGYQHLWMESRAIIENGLLQMTWFNKGHFYSVTSTAEEGDELLLTRIGANDPKFNLRRDPGLIHRRTAGNTIFASLYEIHGQYDFASEIPINSFTSVASVDVLYFSKDYAVVSFELVGGAIYRLAISLVDPDANQKHKLTLNDGTIEWIGPTNFQQNSSILNETKQ